MIDNAPVFESILTSDPAYNVPSEFKRLQLKTQYVGVFVVAAYPVAINVTGVVVLKI